QYPEERRKPTVISSVWHGPCRKCSLKRSATGGASQVPRACAGVADDFADSGGGLMDLRDTFERLVALNRDAFAAGEYPVAYHVLEAALECASGLRDDWRLTDIQKLAEEQGAWIDAHAPGHRLSSQSAAQRGTQAVYLSLARTAAVLLAGLQAE